VSASTNPNPVAPGAPVRRLTISDIARLHADGQRIAMITAYDYPVARLLDESGIPILLVGDSLGRAVLGYENEIPVSMDDMLHHAKAVAKGARSALIVGDMPFLSYATPEQAVHNAGRFLAEAGLQAVKVEGGRRTARTIEAITRAGIPVMGHIGLTPQSVNQIGKLRVLGKTRDAARDLLADAMAVQEAGAFSVVLELVPEQLATAITERLQIPTFGIGAGAGCSGQVQVLTDLLGYEEWHPRHARPYANLRETILAAARAYQADVEAGTFPGLAETVRMDDDVIDEVLGHSALDRPGRSIPAGGIPLDRDL